QAEDGIRVRNVTGVQTCALPILPMFNGVELERFIELASYVTVNDYESEMVQNRTGLSLQELAARVDAYIVTSGPRGSHVYTQTGDRKSVVSGQSGESGRRRRRHR